MLAAPRELQDAQRDDLLGSPGFPLLPVPRFPELPVPPGVELLLPGFGLPLIPPDEDPDEPGVPDDD